MQNSHPRFVFIVILIIISGLVLFWSWTPTNFSNPNCEFTQNAAWISVDWTSSPVDKNTVKQLAESAKSRNLKYLFPYVSYLKSDGSFSQSDKYAHEFVRTFRQFNTNTRLLAWVGVPLATHLPIGVQGWVDLSNKDTREQIVQYISGLVKQSDFDGVHINAETIRNNDPYYLNLLEEVRQEIGNNKMISIAGSHWYPDFLSILPIIRDVRWTSSYYREVGQRVEQIATMTYDSYTFHPALYRLWMREQIKGISSSLKNNDVEVLIGISVSQERTLSHWPAVESLENGLAGICIEIPQEAINGIAVYADWEFSQSDWQVWDAWQR